MSESLFNLILFFVLVSLSAYFSASEVALTSVKKPRLLNMIVKKTKKNKHFSNKLIGNYSSTLTTILIANNFLNIVAASIALLIFQQWFEGYNYILLSTLFTTSIILIFGEILPKVFAAKYPEKFIINFAFGLYILCIIFSPLTWLFGFLIPDKETFTSTEKELLSTLAIIEKEGVIEKKEQTLISSAIKFDDQTIRNNYILWEDVTSIEHEKTIGQALEKFAKSGFSRLPVIKNQKPIGVLFLKEILMTSKKEKVENYARKVTIFSQNEKLSEVLNTLQHSIIHMGFVKNKKTTKKIIGIVTMENILEKLVGNIYDENDQIPKITALGVNSFRVIGSALTKDVFSFINGPQPLVNDVTFAKWVKLQTDVKDFKKLKPFVYSKFLIKFLETKNRENVFVIEEQ